MDRESWARARPDHAAGREKAAGGVRKVAAVLGAALGLLLLLEIGLQLRSQVKTGESIFNLLFAETHYVEDPATGLHLLRPNRVFVSNGVTMRTNSLGLRSAEILPARPPGSWRLAAVGASTVLGAYAADNDKTFSARLEARLRRDFPDRPIEVVNAGIVGYGLEEETRMLERRIAPLRPDLVIVYTGFNDFLAYCREGPAGAGQAAGLPLLTLPKWLLSVDLLKKNTVFLRTSTARQAGHRDPRAVDPGPFRHKLETMIQRARSLGLPLLLSTNAKAYRREQPLDEQMSLSETDRYYTHCFDLDGLHVLYERHNALIREVAAAHGLPVIELDQAVPGGRRYFADSHHFSAEGEALVADALAAFILGRKLLPPG